LRRVTGVRPRVLRWSILSSPKESRMGGDVVRTIASPSGRFRAHARARSPIQPARSARLRRPKPRMYSTFHQDRDLGTPCITPEV
jgi:hypothetical protein